MSVNALEGRIETIEQFLCSEYRHYYNVAKEREGTSTHLYYEGRKKSAHNLLVVFFEYGTKQIAALEDVNNTSIENVSELFTGLLKENVCPR